MPTNNSGKVCVGRMFTKSQLDECCKADFNTCKVKDLPDVTNPKIDVEEPIINRARKYFMDIKIRIFSVWAILA